MSLKRRLIAGILLSMTLTTVGLAHEAEARGFDYYDKKLELIKLKKLKKAKAHHVDDHHHVKHVQKKPVKFKKYPSYRRSRRRSFGYSPYGKKSFYKRY